MVTLSIDDELCRSQGPVDMNPDGTLSIETVVELRLRAGCSHVEGIDGVSVTFLHSEAVAGDV